MESQMLNFILYFWFLIFFATIFWIFLDLSEADLQIPENFVSQKIFSKDMYNVADLINP